MIGRRAVLAAGAGLIARPAGAALPVPPSGALAFRMVRHDSEIGRHTLAFEHQGDTLTIDIAVDAAVSLLSIPIYRYRHRLVETWQGETLSGLVGTTDKNGEREWVQAQRTAEGLVVLGSQTQRYIAPEGAIGISYWNRLLMEAPMISLEDGVLLHPTVTVLGAETIRLASGVAIAADHYRIRGTFKADVWYDRADTWAGLELTVADGSTIHYERL